MPGKENNNATVLDAIIKHNESVKEQCAEDGLDYRYEIFNHDKYVISMEQDLDTKGFEYHLYGKENSKNKGFICTFPTMSMAMRMIARLKAL